MMVLMRTSDSYFRSAGKGGATAGKNSLEFEVQGTSIVQGRSGGCFSGQRSLDEEIGSRWANLRYEIHAHRRLVPFAHSSGLDFTSKGDLTERNGGPRRVSDRCRPGPDR
jgi:hypothetical protein